MLNNPIQAWFGDVMGRAKIAAAPRNVVLVVLFHVPFVALWYAVAATIAPEITSQMWPYSLAIHVAITLVFQLMTAKPTSYGRSDAA